MNKTYDELCDEILQLREQLQNETTLKARVDYLEARLEKTEKERARLTITLQAFGQLVPTHYDDRDELFRAVLHILRTAPQGYRCRIKAFALRDYVNSLHPAHACRPLLLSEAERLNDLADQHTRGGT